MVRARIDAEEARRLVESSGNIHLRDFWVSLGALTGIAFVCFIFRTAIRIRYQKALRLDDAFLILAAACLGAATGILYNISYFLYLHTAALHIPELLPFMLANYMELLTLQKRVYPFLCLIWTATFAVKGCFLVFMRPLIWHISRPMNWYYWFVVVFCVLSWGFVVVDPSIICPYFDLEAVKCFNSTVNPTKTLALTAFVTVLDILSDIMIVSLAIIVLRSSQLSRSTKFGLSVFLGLSIFMAICAICRISGFHHDGLEDDTWQFYWQHAEGAVAVMMASVTAFSALFVKPKRNEDLTTPRSPAGSWMHQILSRFQALARAKPTYEEKSGDSAAVHKTSMLKLPQVPGATFKGLRTFIRKNNRTSVSTCDFDTLHSSVHSVSNDYHAALKSEKLSATSNNV